MKLSKITEQLKNGTYGDQGIAPNTASEYIWANMRSLVLDPLNSKMKVDLFESNNEIYDKENDSFNEEVEFPSVKYIKDEFSYDYIDQHSLVGSVVLPASKRTNLSLISCIAPSDASVGRFLFNIDITSKYGKEFSYKAEIAFPDADSGEETRTKVITIWPRKLMNTEYRTSQYLDDTSQPQFYDVEQEDTVASVELAVELPSLLGDEYKINVTLEDWANYSDNNSDPIEVSVFENKIIEEGEDIRFNSDQFVPLVNQSDIIDFDKIQPTFETFIMRDQDVITMMQYIVTTYNWISDEAQTGNEQKTAFTEFNSKIPHYPTSIFMNIVPTEFKYTSEEMQEKGLISKWDSGKKFVARRY